MAEAPFQTSLEELTVLPQIPKLFLGEMENQEEGKAEERGRRETKGQEQDKDVPLPQNPGYNHASFYCS